MFILNANKMSYSFALDTAAILGGDEFLIQQILELIWISNEGVVAQKMKAKAEKAKLEAEAQVSLNCVCEV